MATIKLKILLDSENQNDAVSFANLMNAFSGAPSVQLSQVVKSAAHFPLQELNTAITAQSPTSQQTEEKTTEAVKVTDGEIKDYSEQEMLDMPNTELKDYVTGLGIEWAKAEGKNTNRKLANLVLEFREVKGGISQEIEDPAAEKIIQEGKLDKAENETAEDDLAEEEESSTGITYNDLKISLGKKVDQHRDAIVAKLRAFGATKMPNLDEKHWEAMYNFMESL